MLQLNSATGYSSRFHATDRYLDRIDSLPPVPTVAIQLLDQFNDPDRDLDRIVQLISHDPSLTAETLKRCNSGALVGAEPASDMFEAVCRLGLFEVYSIVVGLVASRTMKPNDKCKLDSLRLWRHSVTTAVICATLARRSDLPDATAFTAGLLHDIGKLILGSTEGGKYCELVHQSAFYGPSLIAAEVAKTGFSHATLGARLLARWGLPEVVCCAVEWHPQLPAVIEGDPHLTAIVNFSNSLAHELVEGTTGAPAAVAISAEAMRLLNLTPEELPALLTEINLGMQRVQGLMQMQG